jgi:hypothetical protein
VASLGGAWVGVRLVIRAENRDAVAYRISDRLIAPRRTKRAGVSPRVSVRVASGAGSTLRRARARSTK